MHIDEDRLYQHIGREFRRRRLKLGLTQTDLASATEELRTSITNIEAGRQRPPLHVLYRICLVLGLEPSEMLPRIAEIAEQPGNSALPLTEAFVQDVLQNDERPDDDRSRR